MDRAIIAAWPEFACLTHRLPMVTARQHELLLPRIARNALRLESGCIVWNGAHNNDGYGRMTVWDQLFKRRVVLYVHRVAWMMKSGKPIPTWREIAHSCDVPACFHPEHLQLQRIPDNRRASADNTHRKLLRAATIERLAQLGDALRIFA